MLNMMTIIVSLLTSKYCNKLCRQARKRMLSWLRESKEGTAGITTTTKKPWRGRPAGSFLDTTGESGGTDLAPVQGEFDVSMALAEKQLRNIAFTSLLAIVNFERRKVMEIYKNRKFKGEKLFNQLPCSLIPPRLQSAITLRNMCTPEQKVTLGSVYDQHLNDFEKQQLQASTELPLSFIADFKAFVRVLLVLEEICAHFSAQPVENTWWGLFYRTARYNAARTTLLNQLNQNHPKEDFLVLENYQGLCRELAQMKYIISTTLRLYRQALVNENSVTHLAAFDLKYPYMDMAHLEGLIDDRSVIAYINMKCDFLHG